MLSFKQDYFSITKRLAPNGAKNWGKIILSFLVNLNDGVKKR